MGTNILVYAFSEDSPHHKKAYQWMSSIQHRDDVIISEFILAEFYGLLRNKAVFSKPMSAGQAADVIRAYRAHPVWRICGFHQNSRKIHDRLWKMASKSNFPSRRFYDFRTALFLQAHGVTEFATRNVKDFKEIGFLKLWDPCEP